MLGIYISGHPLEKLEEAIAKQTNINSIQIKDLNGENTSNFKDGQTVKYAGTISSVKKKYTKRNTIMAFVTVEDLYGSVEIIVFDSVYSRINDILYEEKYYTNQRGLRDVIMIATMDRKHGMLKLTSLMRDLRVFVPAADGYEKFNAATNHEGEVKSLYKTIAHNF